MNKLYHCLAKVCLSILLLTSITLYIIKSFVIIPYNLEDLGTDEERPGFQYNEGCDTITVPFKQRECYCKQNLCNSANKDMLVKKEVFIVGFVMTLMSKIMAH